MGSGAVMVPCGGSSRTMLTGRLTGVGAEVRVEWWRRWRGCGGRWRRREGSVRAGRGGAGGVWCSSSTWDGDVPVTPQRQVPAVFLRRRGGASIQFLDRALDSPVMQRRFPTVQTVLKTVDIARCRSWTRLLTARCCAVLVLIQTAQLCAVLDKGC